MSRLVQGARLEALRARHAPYLALLLERAGALAAELHADRVAIEHLVAATMRDEESAANQAVVFAFADPETVLQEVLALCPGILVVGSRSTRPFSSGAVRALALARSRATRSGADAVALEHLAGACLDVLPPDLRREVAPAAPPLPEAEEPSASAAKLGEEAKRALSRAALAAAQAREPSIGPARVLLAILQVDPGEGAALGLGRAHPQLARATVDATPPDPRPLELEEALFRFLEGLGAGSGSLAVLAACHGGATAELASLLLRHKLGPELIERSRGHLLDPD